MKNNKAFLLIEIIISFLMILLFTLTFFSIFNLIKINSSQNSISTECLSVCSSKIETIMYNSHLLTLKKIGSSYPIYNLIDQKELNYNSSFNVYESFKKHYLSGQIPFYFYEAYKDFYVATRIRVYSGFNKFYNVTVYCYHKRFPYKKYSITSIIESKY